ncbi:DEAD/DEAH box helicase [bacterium]|nr:DEAD/DEAH box helicase [bacterium]
MNTNNKRRPRGGNRNAGRNRPASAKKQSKLNPDLLVKNAVHSEKTSIVTSSKYEDLGLHPDLLRNILSKGYEFQTEIQEQTLHPLLDGRDIMGIAKTGTGKTGAFLIPIIEQLLTGNRKLKTIVLVPTRELALQVKEELESLVRGMSYTSACFIGGTNINNDIRRLSRNLDFLVGTPGRVLDLHQRGVLKLNVYNVMILDEFDRMLDMGFINDVKKITASIGNRDQTMLFSATKDDSQKQFIHQLLRNPITVKVSSGEASSDHIDQEVINIKKEDDKFEVLLELLYQKEFSKVLVFTETKRLASRIAIKLNKCDISTEQIHGNKSQNQRQNALNRFKEGKVRVLVATDVAARGIDIDDITHVINYHVPMTMDSYIHRIGRTGRAGRKGKAITLVQ